MWDLFATAPLMLYHPDGLQLVIGAVTKSKSGRCYYWLADYSASVNATGIPDSGYPYYELMSKPKYDKKTDMWVVKSWEEGHRFSRVLPPEVQRAWDVNKQYVQTIAEFQKQTECLE